MTDAISLPTEPRFLSKPGLGKLIDRLRAQGYTVIGPRIADEAVVYSEISSASDLPRGWSDSQQPGRYRVQPSGDDSYFGYNLGPHSWKRYLFPPRAIVGTAERGIDGWDFSTPPPSATRYAFLGVRACELAAIAVQDRVFLQGPYEDPIYRAQREAVLMIAVNCTTAAETCFCTSMKTGPRCKAGFDLALTEIPEGFVVQAGSQVGADLLNALDTETLQEEMQVAAANACQRAVDQIVRQVDTRDLHASLLGQLEHPRWAEVAERCLSCTNCTMVCPTCFCSSVGEVTDLSQERVERERTWDSCFNRDFSYIGGGIVRNDIRSRYRQWLTHKFASWHDQFGTSGCVGCGRCITWCPVGIDVTEELAALGTPASTRSLPVIALQEAQSLATAKEPP